MKIRSGFVSNSSSSSFIISKNIGTENFELIKDMLNCIEYYNESCSIDNIDDDSSLKKEIKDDFYEIRIDNNYNSLIQFVIEKFIVKNNSKYIFRETDGGDYE